MLKSSSSSLIGRLSGLSAFWVCQFRVMFTECDGVRSGAPVVVVVVDVGGSRENMDSRAAIEFGDCEKCDTASTGGCAWFDCMCQSRPAPALIANGTGPCPGLNAPPPPTLEPPSELGDPVTGSACMRE